MNFPRALLLLVSLGVTGAEPTTRLNNGVEMPMVAAGVWEYNSSTAAESIALAFAAGFTHFDTAHDYNNQDGVGAAFKEAVAKAGRSSLFLTSKVPGCGYQGVGKGSACHNDTIKLFEEDLSLLGVDFLDLVLVHFPPGGCGSLKCEEIQQQWSAMEAMYALGKARAIGVSNYCISCFKCLNETMKVKPAVNQVEFHVGMGSDPEHLKSYLQQQNIQMQAYSALGSGNKDLISGNLTNSIGQHYNKTGAQVALKWVLTNDVPLVVKADSAKYLGEDIDLFDFTLSAADVATLTASAWPPGLPSFMCLSSY